MTEEMPPEDPPAEELERHTTAMAWLVLGALTAHRRLTCDMPVHVHGSKAFLRVREDVQEEEVAFAGRSEVDGVPRLWQYEITIEPKFVAGHSIDD